MATKKKKYVEPVLTEQKEVFVYLGPSIRGVIQNGTIYQCTKDELTKTLDFAISAYPDIAPLVVKADEVMATKNNITNGVGRAARAYRALLKIN